jgi:hypothetical protein
VNQGQLRRTSSHDGACDERSWVRQQLEQPQLG